MEFSPDGLLLLYRNMVRGRKYDEKYMEIYYEGKIRSGAPHTGIGQEAVGAGSCTFLRPDDYLVKSHRGPTQDLSKGMPMSRLFAAIYNRKTAGNQGKGSLHEAYMERGICGFGGTIGSCFPLATGFGIAAQRAGRRQAVLCVFGDGAAQRGTLHESMNWTSVLKLPIVWLCENNLYYAAMPLSKAMAIKDLAALAGSYAMPSEIVDGQDVLAVTQATATAIDRAREGGGPTFLECKTYRFRGHEEVRGPHGYAGVEDPRDKQELACWLGRDPIKLFRERLLNSGFTLEELDAVDKAAATEVREAEAWAEASPLPEPETAFEGVYSE